MEVTNQSQPNEASNLMCHFDTYRIVLQTHHNQPLSAVDRRLHVEPAPALAGRRHRPPPPRTPLPPPPPIRENFHQFLLAFIIILWLKLAEELSDVFIVLV